MSEDRLPVVSRQDWMGRLDAYVEQQADAMREIRRHLHRHPEPSGCEVVTTQYVDQLLQDLGLEADVQSTGCGLVVDRPQANNRCIALRADMDAICIQDTKDVAYASQVPGVMHACGHDGHTAIVYGAIAALVDAERHDDLPWVTGWRGIFQPAEETNEGALEMVRQGVLDGVQAILSLHLDPSRSVGTIGVREGSFTADCHTLEIEVRGRGSHAARPHESSDPIAAAAQLVTAIYLFVPRGTDSQDPVVVSFGQIYGGDTHNAIPDQVNIRGTLRTLHADVSQATLDHILRLSRGVAEASGTNIHVHSIPGPPAVVNDGGFTKFVSSVAREALGPDAVQEIRRPSMGGEDFAHYLLAIPGAMFRLGCSKSAGQPTTLHAADFDFDERALVVGAKLLARSVVAWNRPEARSGDGAD